MNFSEHDVKLLASIFAESNVRKFIISALKNSNANNNLISNLLVFLQEIDESEDKKTFYTISDTDQRRFDEEKKKKHRDKDVKIVPTLERNK